MNTFWYLLAVAFCLAFPAAWITRRVMHWIDRMSGSDERPKS